MEYVVVATVWVVLIVVVGEFVYTRFIDHQVTTAYYARHYNATMPYTDGGVTYNRAYESPEDTMVVEMTLGLWTAPRAETDPTARQHLQQAIKEDAQGIACTDPRVDPPVRLRPSARVRAVLFNVPHDDHVEAEFRRGDCP